MELKKLFPKHSKQGVTLVEIVFGVVVLGIITIGIITALATGATTIEKKAAESSAHAEAVQKMDAAIAYLSNGTFSTTDVARTDVAAFIGVPKDDFIMNASASYTNAQNDAVVPGWQLSLKYKGQTVTGYASNTKGVFDQ